MTAQDPLLAFRDEFPILERTTYLVSNSLGPMPRTVPARLGEYASDWGGKGVKAWNAGWWELPVTVGNVIAPLIGAGENEVVMLPNVSIAQATVLSALDFPPERNRIVMTDLDFPSVRYGAAEMAPRVGAEIVSVVSDDGIGVDMERLLQAIDERTRLVAVSHVLFKSAFVLDAARICARAREVGALVCLDAFHSVGVVPVDVAALGVDFLTGGVLKWLCGGPGGCFLYVSPAIRDELTPSLTGWQAHERPFDFAPEMRFTTGAFRWLNGTPVIPALYVAAEGPKIVQRAGIESIRLKSMRQTARLVELADARGYEVRAPRDPAHRGGTVAVDVPNAGAVAQDLVAREILVDYRVGAGIRIAPHFFTRDSELDDVFAAIDASLASGSWKRYAGLTPVVT
ncbi:MAG TPA: aminotransferase class V-fold PLP-dependent enzyme [Gemmatimonadaceae bacterium]|nr:aminotransferase class V-fold PLP-dependent enzyme [Gemmatimonadaceae bacterium]